LRKWVNNTSPIFKGVRNNYRKNFHQSLQDFGLKTCNVLVTPLPFGIRLGGELPFNIPPTRSAKTVPNSKQIKKINK